ncbi:hypothetical protein P7H12_00265 [Paenibacillus larvae]|nr:hypothetical protein [Paenibacillus larvae]MDT2262406.1 hypothetical protein [Paenibacillus larvae]
MHQQIENSFKYHSPKPDSPENIQNYEKRRKNLYVRLMKFARTAGKKSLAITNLEQVVVWANASIARNEVSE